MRRRSGVLFSSHAFVLFGRYSLSSIRKVPMHMALAVILSAFLGAAVYFKLIGPGEWVQAVLVAALVIVTTFYARSASSQARDMRIMAQASQEQIQASQDQTQASLRPVIVLGRYNKTVDPGASVQVQEQPDMSQSTDVCNVGSGPALNVRFSLRTPNRSGALKTVEWPELRGLGVGEWYELRTWDKFQEIGWEDCDLTVEYYDVFDNPWRSGVELHHPAKATQFVVGRLFFEKGC